MVLRFLRGRRGWPRVIALALVFAFSAGLMHVHPTAGSAVEQLALEDSHSGHDHDNQGSHEQSASVHCGFCAVFAGNFFTPVHPGFWAARQRPVENGALAHSALAALQTDLFRPPIATRVG
jgi:hypothetical protein